MAMGTNNLLRLKVGKDFSDNRFGAVPLGDGHTQRNVAHLGPA